MTILEVKERSETLIEQLLGVWESSVRATHLFLSEEEIMRIRQYVPQAIWEVSKLVIAQNDKGRLCGFMGIAGQYLEMLFVADEERGKGIGKELLLYGMNSYGINDLSVNEQNPQAAGFYEHMGFTVYKRTECDEQGDPYPLLYMNRKD